MKMVVAAALALLLLLFLMPVVFLPDTLQSGKREGATLSPLPTPVAAEPAAQGDRHLTVRVKLGEGEIAEMSMADYLWRVVAAEMPASFHPEALKAQTAAARTYTLARLGRENPNHPGADMCGDITCCQAYVDPAAAAKNWGVNAETYTRKIADAVSETDGMAIFYNGAPIDAVFFSSAAGRTVDAVEVWGNSVPYLAGVSSPEGEEVPNYHSETVFSPEEFKALVAAHYPAAKLDGSPAGWFGAVTVTSNGGVGTILVGGVLIKGTALRALLGLRSASFTVEAGEQAITFRVTGYGHGVGLSQYGANALAGQGKTWQEIVQWYYTGVTVAPYSG